MGIGVAIPPTPSPFLAVAGPECIPGVVGVAGGWSKTRYGRPTGYATSFSGSGVSRQYDLNRVSVRTWQSFADAFVRKNAGASDGVAEPFHAYVQLVAQPVGRWGTITGSSVSGYIAFSSWS